MRKTQSCNPLLTRWLLRGFAFVLLMSSLSTQALRFEPTDEIVVDLDTTLAYGAMWRVEEQDDMGPIKTPGHFGVDPGPDGDFAATGDNIDNGVNNDPDYISQVLRFNSDDGNRNFEKGDLVSNRVAITSDLDLSYENMGLFLRGQMFYDSVYFEETSWDGDDWSFWGDPAQGYDPADLGENPTCGPATSPYYGCGTYGGPESLNNAVADGSISDPSHFSDSAKDTHGYNARFLDAYVYGNFNIGDRTLALRVGRQAISWGEALMLQGGIGFAQNRIDAAAATSPGVELKEIFLPTGSVYGQYDLSDTLTVEAYWQYEWKPSELFATGSYFSAQDMLDSDIFLTNTEFRNNCMYDFGQRFNPINQIVCDNSSPYTPIFPAGLGEEHYLTTNYNYMAKAPDVEPDHQSDQYGLAFRQLLDGGSEMGVYFVQYHDKYPSLWALNNGAVDNTLLLSPGFGTDTSNAYGFNSRMYTIEYKERIKLYGLTLNTVVNDVQVGLELTYRENQPIVPACTIEDMEAGTIDYSITNPDPDVEQYMRALSYRSDCKDAGVNMLAFFGYDASLPASATNFDADSFAKLPAWPTEAEVFTYNAGITMVVPPTPLWDTGILVAELGGWYVGGDFEDKDLKVTDIGGFTQRGYGLSAIFLPQYKNVMEGVDLTIPFFVNYTVEGSFSYYAYNEGALWASVGLEAVYLSNMRVGLVYSAFGGANQMWRDRDNISVTMKYTF